MSTELYSCFIYCSANTINWLSLHCR
jgi:hypothetical protein